MFFGDRPVTNEIMNETTASTKKTARRVLPISIDKPPTPPAPSIKATNAIIKNAIAARTI